MEFDRRTVLKLIIVGGCGGLGVKGCNKMISDYGKSIRNKVACAAKGTHQPMSFIGQVDDIGESSNNCESE